jgi:hypothetical protein
MGKREDAMVQFKQIYAVDAGYKDIEDKMNAFLDGQG